MSQLPQPGPCGGCGCTVVQEVRGSQIRQRARSCTFVRGGGVYSCTGVSSSSTGKVKLSLKLNCREVFLLLALCDIRESKATITCFSNLVFKKGGGAANQVKVCFNVRG